MLGVTVVEKNDLHPVRSIITTNNNSTYITKDTEVEVAVIDKTGLLKMQILINRKMFTSTIISSSNNIPLISIRKEVGAVIPVAGQEAETRSGVVANHPPSPVGILHRENLPRQTAITLSAIMTTQIGRRLIET